MLKSITKCYNNILLAATIVNNNEYKSELLK